MGSEVRWRSRGSLLVFYVLGFRDYLQYGEYTFDSLLSRKAQSIARRSNDPDPRSAEEAACSAMVKSASRANDAFTARADASRGVFGVGYWAFVCETIVWWTVIAFGPFMFMVVPLRVIEFIYRRVRGADAGNTEMKSVPPSKKKTAMKRSKD